MKRIANKQATSAVTEPVSVGSSIPLSSEIKMLLEIECSIHVVILYKL